MESGILHDLSPLIRVYKDGRIHRLEDPAPVKPGLDPQTGVVSKDITVFPDREVSVRLFKPNLVEPKLDNKVPLLVYFHGGGFCIESTFSPLYHNYLNSLAYRARIFIVSVEYRLAPEHLLPAAYDDCWDALNWVFSHVTPDNDPSKDEAWIRESVDFSRVFLGGDSAGANITHHMALQIGIKGLANGSIHSINGIILFHPYFWSANRIGDELAKLTRQPNPNMIIKLWSIIVCPERSGSDDPWINPAHDPSLSRLGCKRVLVLVGEKDVLSHRGWHYKEVLEKSGWQGKVEVIEFLGEDHVFHLFNPLCANALDLMAKVVHFLNHA